MPETLASTPDRRFKIVPRRRFTRVLVVVLALAWLASLWLAVALTRSLVAPGLGTAEQRVAELEAELGEANGRIETLRDRNTVLKRSDQISRAANAELQGELTGLEEEIAQLRADVGFYERLVGASGQRQGLAVHSLSMRQGAAGAHHYSLTLTQNLKKAKVSKGELTMRIDGVRAGKLSSLHWGELLQQADAKPVDFAFKYFQQLEGSVMVPADFTPHRVWIKVKSDSGSHEESFPWDATRRQGA
ncbi:MAG TPA: DUF6776 family protein [Xanthomonadaceae bacterium]|nr:DUF6776 family protein [Xanthomonadaceae bacterium]